MNFSFYAFLSLSIALPAAAGLVRVWKVDRRYLPFIFLVWLGLLNESLSIYLARHRISNAINYNVYLILDAVILTWQFRNWGLFRRAKWVFWAVLVFFVAWWVAESFLYEYITDFDSHFVMIYSLAIIVMAVFTLTPMLFFEKYQLLRNPKFIICTVMIVLYTVAVLVEVYWRFGFKVDAAFRLRIWTMFLYTNAFANLIFTIAILWMPMRPRYLTLPLQTS